MRKIVLLALSSLALSACLHAGLPSNQDSSTNDQSQSPTPFDPQLALRNFITAFSQVDSYIATIVTQPNTGQESTITIKYKKPDSTLTTFSTPTGENQLITTSEATYMKNSAREKWIKFPKDTQTDLTDVQFNPDSLKADLDSQQNIPQYQGISSCGDLNCHIYQTVLDDTTTTIMFDTKDLLLRSVEVTGADPVVMAYDYQDVEINLPQESEVFELPSDPDQVDLDQVNSILDQ